MGFAMRRQDSRTRRAIPLLHLVGLVSAGVIACSAVVAAPPQVIAPRPSLPGGASASPAFELLPAETRIRPEAAVSSPIVSSSVAVLPRSSGQSLGDPVLVGAGDIAMCETTSDSATARLIESIPGIVFTAGDNAYETGSDDNFRECYDPTWGGFESRTLPAIGNHEYNTPGANGYFHYFGERAGERGRAWYSVDVGAWHVVVLNSNCDVVGCGPRSRQVTWLKADLAANPSRCTVAIWHHPLFSSGGHGGDAVVRSFWRALYRAGADVIINGHDHDYERFARQTPRGLIDHERGIREFVVGTGGAQLRPFGAIRPHSRIRTSRTHGVLVLTLHRASYDWRFIRADGAAFTDHGSAACH